MRDSIDVLVLDANSRPTLAIVRSLGAHGLATAVAGRPGSLAFFSRHVAERVVFPDIGEVPVREYQDELLTLLRRMRPGVLMCISDGNAAALHTLRDEVPEEVKIALPGAAAFSATADKAATLAVAKSLGIPIPRGQALSDPSEIARTAAEIGYPVVVKPTRSWRALTREGEPVSGRRVVGALVRNRRELEVVVADLAEPGHPVLVQEYAPGARVEIALVRGPGRSFGAVAVVTTRTWPLLGGNSVMRQTIPMPPAILAQVENLLDSLGYQGFAHAEFRFDARGVPVLMEINNRFCASIELYLRAGVNLPFLLWSLVSGRPLPEKPLPYRTGVRLSWAQKEFAILMAAARGKELRACLTW